MQYYLMEYTDLFPYVTLLQPNSLLTLWLNQDLFFKLYLITSNSSAIL